jgi:hypothetical protein
VDVRPVEDAGHAAVDGAERAKVIAGIDIVRRVVCAERLLHGRDIVVERTVRQHVAQDALPHVAVSIGEARRHDHARGIYHLSIRPCRGHAFAELGDNQ